MTMRPLPTLLVLALAGAFGGFAATALREGQQAHAQAAPLTAPSTALPAAVDGRPLPSLAPMLERVIPAVVSVHTKQRVRIRVPFGDDPFYRKMMGIPAERIQESLGSGVIVDAARGYVLTNHHVIEGADDVSVTLNDGRTLQAQFVGSDPDSDIALMRIAPQNLTAITLADSSRLKVGDFVVAVGNPFGFTQTVTSGIVSAVGRSGLPGLGYQNFIQTDASINPGNSGGALVDLDGRLVGINTASYNRMGSDAGNIGLGFAIPANQARSVMEQLLSGGVVRRGALGVDTQDVDERIARMLGLREPRGVVVAQVYAGSPAAAAGIREGDVIQSANGQRIDDTRAWRNFQGLQSPGAQVRLEMVRNGRPLQLTATLGEQLRSSGGSQLDPRLDGATFAELPEALHTQGISGVLVQDVRTGSRADDNGLRSGDVVLASSSGEFTDLAGFRASLQRAPDRLLLRIWRRGQQGTLLMR